MTLAVATSPFPNNYLPLNTPIELPGNPQILHTTRGRIRIGMSRLAEDGEYAAKLKYALAAVPFITQVRINQAAKSLVINYDSDSTSERQIQEYIFGAIQRADLIIFPSDEVLQALEAEIGENWAEFLENLKNHLSEALKTFLYTLGEISLTLGIIGVIIPLVPGWPFLLLSSLCFFTVIEMSK